MAINSDKVWTSRPKSPLENVLWGYCSVDNDAQVLYNLIVTKEKRNIQFYMKRMGMKKKPRKEQTTGLNEVTNRYYTKDVVKICYLVAQLVNAGLIRDPVNRSNPKPSNRVDVYLSHETNYRIKL